jgi:hypothetical protein
MPEQDHKPTRPWQEIAAEVVKEKDSKRVLELAKELNDALDSQPPSSNEERPRKKSTAVQEAARQAQDKRT